MGHILLKRYDPKTKTESGVCCITDRSEYAAAQQVNEKGPYFFSENGQTRKEALEVARVWIALIHQLGLPIKKPIKIEKDPQTGKLLGKFLPR